MDILSSTWDGLNEYLIAEFYECDKHGVRVDDTPIVSAPLTESNMDMTLNWQSPFEQAGPESASPTLFAMLQSGEITNTIDAAAPIANKLGADSAAISKAKQFVSSFEGRTGITKLNSIQTFSGMPPIKIQVTALFRAWSDAREEVEKPVDQLMSWALPIELAANGAVVNTLKALNGDMKWSDAILPSKSPCFIGMLYKGRTYSPLVIESIGFPMSSPITEDGIYAELLVPMTLCTLMALDRKDYKKLTNW